MAEPKKRGRQPLSPEQRNANRAKRIANANAYHKSTGWAAQEKYRQTHLDKYKAYRERVKGTLYEPKIRIPIANKPTLLRLLGREDVSLTELVVALIDEKYGINLLDPVDKVDK